MPTRDITVDWGVTGLTGTIAYTVVGSDGTDLIARTTLGVAEQPAGSGIYHAVVDTWEASWVGRVVWDAGGSGVGAFAEESFDAMPASSADLSAALASAGTTVTIVNPVDEDGNTTLVQGDDYTSGNGIADRRLTYTFTGFTGSLSGVTVEWSLTPVVQYERANGSPAELTVTSGTATLSGSTLTVKVPITGAQTAALRHVSLTSAIAGYRVQVVLLDASGNRVTELLADGVILKRVGLAA